MEQDAYAMPVRWVARADISPYAMPVRWVARADISRFLEVPIGGERRR